MTNDTESRLRDFLDAKASTVLDDALAPSRERTPSQEITRRRLHWPVMAAAAAVLALVLPLALHFGNRETPASDTGTLVWKAGAGKVSTIAKPSGLQVPYLLSTLDITEHTAVLYDGTTRVTLPPAQMPSLVGRVANGWVIKLSNLGVPEVVGILDRSGRFAQLATHVDWAVLSPDGTKVAVGRRIGDTNRLVVIDVAAGRQVAMLPTPYSQIQVYGWNRDGVWYSEYVSGSNQPQPHVWQPGAEPRVVELSGFKGIQVAANSNRLAVTVQIDGRQCVRVVTLPTTGTFTTLREHCLKGGRAHYSFLAPDGEALVYPDDRLTLQVGSGKVTRLTGLVGRPDPTANVYEESGQLLVDAQDPKAAHNAGPNPPQVISRCDVRSGICRPVHRQEAWYTLRLGTP